MFIFCGNYSRIVQLPAENNHHFHEFYMRYGWRILKMWYHPRKKAKHVKLLWNTHQYVVSVHFWDTQLLTTDSCFKSSSSHSWQRNETQKSAQRKFERDYLRRDRNNTLNDTKVEQVCILRQTLRTRTLVNEAHQFHRSFQRTFTSIWVFVVLPH